MRLRRATRDLWIPAGLALLVAGGWGLERAESFGRIREAFRAPAVPAAVLNRGSVGRALRRLKLVVPIRNDGRVFPPSAHPKAALDASLFQKKRKVGESLYAPNREWVRDLAEQGGLSPPSVPPDAFREGWPLIAVQIDEGDLYGDKWGIVANHWGRGREWERPASVAYYVDGQRVFSTLAGLRLHGGQSRKPGQTHSFRVHFREEYGASEFPRGLVFGPECEPIRRLVVHADWPEAFPFAGLLAFDAAERVGCAVPRTQPVLFALNGELQPGLHWLSEHVGRAAWANRIGHRDFLMYVMKGQKENESFRAYGGFHLRLLAAPAPLDLAAIEREVDLDNLSAYTLAMAYGGTSDGYQGAAWMDPRAERPRWAWINWDMDHSFWDVYGDPGQRKPWQKESWERALVRPGDRRYADWKAQGDARSVLFTRLMDECPAYRRRFLRYAADMLNHRLTESFMLERVAHYERLARTFGRTDLAFAEDYREFVRRRPEVLREGLRQWFGVGEFHRVEVRAPEGAALRIDGFEEASPYAGWYFDGQTLEVESSGEPAAWRVNGEPAAAGPRLARAVDRDLSIDAAP